MRPSPTLALGVVAVGTTALATAFEYAHVWRRGHAPPPERGQSVTVSFAREDLLVLEGPDAA